MKHTAPTELPVELPIEQQRASITTAAAQSGFCLLLRAPTGSGKSTRVAHYLHEAGCTRRGMVIVVQPRRLAARMLAGYVAQQWPCKLGEEVGYAVRHDSCYREWTSVLFVTDGVLERWMGRDASLEGISAIIFDEVHERRLSGDLCLARALQLQAGARPDLGLVVMSASLELDKLQDYLPHAQLIEAQGRLYPVDISYRRPLPRRDARGAMSLPAIWEQVAESVSECIQQGEQGDILVFLPGSHEIRRSEELLRQLGCLRGWDIYPLHGQLNPEQQRHAIQQGSRPRVILSTNIAETSLTIQGVSLVIDSGLVRESRWEAARGLASLHLVGISQAQADQRAGRAGRVRAGRCLRLWGESEHHRRAAFPAPEVHRADLSAAFLNLLAWGCAGMEGERGIASFPWPEPPEPAASAQAWRSLGELGAITPQGELSAIGEQMRHYPLPPILARLMVAGKQADCLAEMAAIAALMGGERIERADGLSDKLREPSDYSDFQAEWRALRAAISHRYDARACTALGISARAAREIAQGYRQLVPAAMEPDFDTHRHAITQALLDSMPEHVCVLNSRATQTARLLGRKAGKLDARSVARQASSSPLFLASEVLELGARSVEIRLSRCTLIEESQLQLSTRDCALYDSSRKRVINSRQLVYRDELVVREWEEGSPAPDEAAALLASELLRGKTPLKSWDGHVIQWVNRLHCLREAMPELEMPSFAEEDKQVALTMLCEGASSLREVESRPLLPILREWLSPWQRDCLDRYAPRTLKLANGREVKLVYREDGTPSFGLKCQLLFGVQQTPTIAEGRIRCLVEILAPNMRPYQVTSDLASFWKSGYAQMKKDIAGRYPRHDWRDDPHGG